jgi:transcriptional regulator with XRE-family HTH domain
MRSDLQKLFIRRLGEELEARHLSHNTLAKQAKTKGLELSQVSVSRILRGKQDPTLEKIDAIAQVLDIPAWILFTDQYTVEQRVFRMPGATQKGNISKLPTAFAPWSDYQRREKITRKK